MCTVNQLTDFYITSIFIELIYIEKRNSSFPLNKTTKTNKKNNLLKEKGLKKLV